MKTTTQTKTATMPAAAPVPATPPPAPAVAPATPVLTYEPADWSRVAVLLEGATKDEREFFDLLIHEWEQGVYSLPEAALMQGARANGATWITEIEDITGENDVLRGLKLAMLQGDWLAHFLRVLLKTYDYYNPPTPDDVAGDLEDHLIAFQYEIRDARKLIQAHPETVAGEIRQVIQKRPDILSAA
jgi:hypothetical protein